MVHQFAICTNKRTFRIFSLAVRASNAAVRGHSQYWWLLGVSTERLPFASTNPQERIILRKDGFIGKFKQEMASLWSLCTLSLALPPTYISPCPDISFCASPSLTALNISRSASRFHLAPLSDSAPPFLARSPIWNPLVFDYVPQFVTVLPRF